MMTARLTDNHEIMFWAYVEEFEKKYFQGEPRAILEITITFEDYISSTLLPDAFFSAIEEAGKSLGYVLHGSTVSNSAKYKIVMMFTNPKGAL